VIGDEFMNVLSGDNARAAAKLLADLGECRSPVDRSLGETISVLAGRLLAFGIFGLLGGAAIVGVTLAIAGRPWGWLLVAAAAAVPVLAGYRLWRRRTTASDRPF
jgi:hypothetical protein